MPPDVTGPDADTRPDTADVPRDAGASETSLEATNVPADTTAHADTTGHAKTTDHAKAADHAGTADGTEPAGPAGEGAVLEPNGPADAPTPAHSAPVADAGAPKPAGAPADAATTLETWDPAGAETSGDADGPLVADAVELRADLLRLQSGFVDDPRGSVSEAAELVDHATQALVGALRQRQRQAREMWDSGETPDTERLRLAIQRYRDLLNQICQL